MQETGISDAGTSSNPTTKNETIGDNTLEYSDIPRQNVKENISLRESNETEHTDNRNDNTMVPNPYEDEMENDETLEDLGPELAKMGRILAREITKSLSAALVPLQNEINQLKSLKTDLTPATSDMNLLKKENDRLKTKVDQLEMTNIKLKERLNSIEDKLLENNLMFFGIEEKDGETEYDRYETILGIIAATFPGHNYDDKLQAARHIQIEKLIRKGKYNQNSTRPVSVTFSHHCDLVEVLINRKYLPTGIMVSREYGEKTESERKFLKPILKAANNKSGYRRKCQLEGDHLIIKGKHYNRDNISDLPEDLSCYKIQVKKTAIQ